ncbi:MAG: transporter substrate-binding protein [Paenibacillus sp.]|jgi:multiple sugar transport system substrate-binding protein|nr:transporter substrate-binding protein [Paenibacillus sp.]
MKLIKQNRMLNLLCMFMLVFAIILTGCTTGITDEAGGNKGGNSQKITLEFWAAPVMGQVDLKKAIQKYTETIAPHVEIHLTNVPFNGIDEKVNVAIAANTFPDIYMDGAARLGPLSVRGVAAPLDSYVTDDYRLDDFLEGPLEMSRVNGKLMMFLAASNFFQGTLLVNKSLFVKAGEEQLLPDPDTRAWSRDKFSKAVEKIGGLGEGIYGLGLAAGAFDHDKFIDGYIYNDGDEQTNAAYDKVIYNSATNISNLEWLVNLVSSPNAVPGAAGNNDANIFELFKRGKVGIMNNNVGYYDMIQRGLKDGSIQGPMEVMFAHFPTTGGNVGKSWLSVYGLIVKKQDNAEKMREAAKFAMWLTSGKDQDINQALYVSKGHLPVRKSIQNLIGEPEFKKLASMPEKPIRNIFIIPNYQQMRKVWFNQFQLVMANRITAKQALDQFAQEAQKLLDEAKQAK